MLQVQPAVSVGPCFQVILLFQNKEAGQKNSMTLHFQSIFDVRCNSKCAIFSRWTLPGLTERKKCWTKFGILYPISDIPVKTSLLPIPPMLKEKKAITETLTVPQFSQLGQSAPSLALLDASFLLQVRTNIHNSKCRARGKSDLKKRVQHINDGIFQQITGLSTSDADGQKVRCILLGVAINSSLLD